MNILVLGGGQQGRVIAGDLARSLPQSRVDVADVRSPRLAALPNLRWVEADLGDPVALARLMHAHDMSVGALPSRFGFGVMQAAIEARKPLVDVSFSAENPLTLDAAARAAGVAIVPDCGLAPGLSHLAAGYAATQGALEELVIYVGGVAQDPTWPYGYVVTWSLDDLLEEYVRPARIVRDGRPMTLPAFAELETLKIEGAGEMEAFLSDGLRTAIDTLPGVPNMSERTLRWPGHVEAVRPLIESGRFLEEMRARCVVEEPRDLVAMMVRVRWAKRAASMTLVARWDPEARLTAMSRTTALTTSVTAQLMARGGARAAGVHPLELVARDAEAHRFIVNELAKRGVHMQWREDPQA
jgi:lysine 6-dehydrogenase